MNKKSCDVVVIGAGIGGLTLAARLAHAGYKTLVLERMPILGGRYTYANYKGYLIPTGAVAVMYGENDPVIITLKDLGFDVDTLDMKAIPVPKWRIGGKDIEITAKNQTAQLVAAASRNKEELDRINKAMLHAYRWRFPSENITFHDFLLNLTDNKDIYNIYQAICIAIIGPNLWEISAHDFFKYMRTFAGIEMLVPRDGLTPIVDALAKLITDNGGEIMPLTRVQEIIVADGVATGVKAKGKDGEYEIEARVVVSDTGPKRTVELAGKGNFDAGYLGEVAALRPWGGMAFILSSTGPLYDWPGGIYTIDTPRQLVFCDYTLIWPHWAPKGKNWTYSYQAFASMESYDPKKELEAFMETLHATLPNFEEQDGEILAIHLYREGWPCLHAWPPDASHRRTPIENLYNVGDAVNIPEVTAGSGAAEASRIVAEDIMSRIKPAK